MASMSGSDTNRSPSTPSRRPEHVEGRFWIALAGVMLVAIALRLVFPTADPPWNPTVGVVWHDEGAWVHNARNRALWGTWTQDAWNPRYVAPVCTAREFVSFRACGVGTWQARLVSGVTGGRAGLHRASGVARTGG